jgi:hypothetical protein
MTNTAHLSFGLPRLREFPSRTVLPVEALCPSLTFSPDDRYLACFSESGQTVFDCLANVVAYEATAGEYLPRFSPKGTYLASARNGFLDVISHPKGEPFLTLPMGRGVDLGSVDIRFDADEGRVAYLSGHELFAWSLPEGRQIAHFPIPEGEGAIAVRYADEGVIVYARNWAKGGAPTRVTLYDGMTGSPMRSVEVGNSSFGRIYISPTGSSAVVIDYDADSYECWDLVDGVLAGLLSYITVDGEHFSDSEDWVFAGDDHVWRPGTGEVPLRLSMPSDMRAYTLFNEAAGLMAVVVILESRRHGNDHQESGRTFFVDAGSGRIAGESQIRHIPWSESATFSPGGRWFASVSSHNYLVSFAQPLYPLGTIVLTDLAAARS